MSNKPIELSATESSVKKILENGLLLRVQKIHEIKKRKTADFFVDGDGPGYVMEVKTRHDYGHKLNPEDAPRPGVRSLHVDGRIWKYVDSASQQCASVDPSHERLWFLAIVIEGDEDREERIKRALASLYGVRFLRPSDPRKSPIPIFYAAISFFERRDVLDGVLVIDIENAEMALCPNEFGPRFSLVERSTLVRTLRDKHGARVSSQTRAAAVGGYVLPVELRGSLKEPDALTHVRELIADSGANFADDRRSAACDD